MEFTPGLVLKCWTVLVGLFGVACGIARWVYPAWSIAGFMGGIDLILLNVLVILHEIIPLPVFDYLRIFEYSWGKAAVMFFIGALWAGTMAFWISSWVIYWVTGAIWLAVNFIPTFTPMPAFLGERQAGTPAQDKPSGFSDNYSHLQ